MKWLACFLVFSLFSIDAIAAKKKSRFRNKAPSELSEVDRTEHNVVKENGQNVIYKKKNVVDFDDSLIEGEINNPADFYFVHRPSQNFGNLVKKRPNFHKEMLRDSVMIR